MKLSLLASAILTALTAGLISLQAAESAPPNIVLIYVDDLDFDELGIYEPKTALTPAIDRLAKEGMTFSNGFVTSSICTPSRFSVLTGKFASRSKALQTDPNSTWREGRTYPPGGPANVHFNANFLPGERTLAHYLREAGYKTGYTGKWHLGPSAKLNESPNLRLRGKTPESPEGQAAMRKFYQSHVDYVRENFGFDYVDGFYADNARALGKYKYPPEYCEHNPEWMTAKAREFIATASKDKKPFFLYFALTLPHGEGNSLIDTIRKADPLLTPAGKLDALPDSGMPPRESLLTRVKEEGMPQVAAGMLWVDDAVGSILEALEKNGVADNTLVWFISDHGNGAKCALQDGGVRIPFLARWPGMIAPGTSSDALVANIDVVPTSVAAAGGSTGEEPIDGLNLLPVFRDPKAGVRDSLLLEVGYGRAAVTKDWKYIALRFPEDEWKYIQSLGGIQEVNYNASPASKNFRTAGMQNYPHYYDFDQLYNRQTDPNDQVNLFGKPEAAEAQKMMVGELKELLAPLPHAFGEFK